MIFSKTGGTGLHMLIVTKHYHNKKLIRKLKGKVNKYDNIRIYQNKLL